MANLPEDAGWIAGITQLETTDPVLGGPGGKSNEAPAQLASRTKWLRDLLAALAIIDATVQGGENGSGWGVDQVPANPANRATSLGFTIPAAPFPRRAIVTYTFAMLDANPSVPRCFHRLWDGAAPIGEEIIALENDTKYLCRQSMALDVPAGSPLTLYAQVRAEVGNTGSVALFPVRWHALFSYNPA